MFIIDDILEEMAMENIQHFSPHYVCNRANNNNLKEVTDYLLELVGKKLKVYFEVECPDGDSDYAVDSPADIEFKPRKCSICDIEYIPDPERIWVAFDFSPNYLEHVKKKENYKQQLELRKNHKYLQPV